MSGGHRSLAHALIALAILSMTYGNMVALVQKDFKRLLAYSPQPMGAMHSSGFSA